MRSNEFIQRVYELEKEYNGFANIPDDELAKFRKFEKRYFGKSDNKIEKRRKYTRSKRFQDAFSIYLKRTRTVDMTPVEIAKQMNDNPDLTDDGIWRRLMLIPFNVKIPDNRVDKDLKYKLQREEVGILNWMVEGALKWQHEGLVPPQSVRQASNDYRNEMDVTAEFIEECCTTGEHEMARASQMYQRYKQWANDNSQYLMNSTKFGKEMGQKFEKKHDMQGTYYVGLSLNEFHQPFAMIAKHPK